MRFTMPTSYRHYCAPKTDNLPLIHKPIAKVGADCKRFCTKFVERRPSVLVLVAVIIVTMCRGLE